MMIKAAKTVTWPTPRRFMVDLPFGPLAGERASENWVPVERSLKVFS